MENTEFLWMRTGHHHISPRWVLLSLLKMAIPETAICPGLFTPSAEPGSNTANLLHSRAQEVNESPLLPCSFLS